MQPDKLVMMANQIAAFFAAQGEARAVPQIADHIAKFWDPRMRAAIIAHRATGGKDLIPAAAEAVERLARGGTPEPQTRATVFGTDVDGNPTADAG